MKRMLCLCLCLLMLLNACAAPASVPTETAAEVTVPLETVEPAAEAETLRFQQLADPETREALEEQVYTQLVDSLGGSDYYIENIQTSYFSTEYLEETAFNSRENVFFGFTLSELDRQFAGTRYIFTLGEDGNTTVQAFQAYDDTWDQVIRNVAVGSGVLLVCVTVAVATGSSAPAVSLIFAASAKGGASLALSQSMIGGLIAGATEGILSQDPDKALKAGALAASKRFQWCAITGALGSGYSTALSLHGAAANGLSLAEAASIQRESRLPLSFIKNFHSMKEYDVYRSAGLVPRKIGGKWAYVQDVDWDYVGSASDGRTNAQRVLDGLAPLAPDGQPYELHHIGQRQDSPLAILTDTQHHGNHAILHQNSGQSPSKIDRDLFAKEKKVFWHTLLTQEQPAA